MKKLLFISALGISAASSFGQFTLTSFDNGLGYNQNFDSVLPSGTTTAPAISALPNATSGLLNGTTSVTAVSGSVATAFAFPNNEWTYSWGNPTNSANNQMASINGGTLVGSTYTGTTNSTGGFKNYGISGDADRSLGTLASGTSVTGVTNLSMNMGLSLLNGTTTSTGTVALDYTLKTWRFGAANQADGYTLSYALFKGGSGYSASSLSNDANWKMGATYYQSNGGADTFANTPPSATQAGADAGVNGNLAANQRAIKARFELSRNGDLYEPGDLLVIRFSDLNNPGNDQGISIDNLQVVPEPASMAVLGLGIFGLARRRRNK
ncbi:MAG: PEP-CTERM sorting domain-containing protein [Armatimonadota bacterium]